MYTGFKELLVDKIEKDPIVLQEGLEAGAVYRADTLYESVEHKDFLVLRFGEMTSKVGNSMIVPWDILAYCSSGNTDKMKRVSAAARSAVERAGSEATESGRFVLAEFVGIGSDQFDAGFKAIVLATHMRCVASGY